MMAMGMVISLITTVHNSEKYLVTAIASVINQTYKDFELIIFDDGSTDSSLAIATHYTETDKRIRLVRSSHIGRIPALIEASAIANGEYLGLLDSDDWLSDNCLEATLRSLESNHMAGMAYTRCALVDKSSKFLRFRDASEIPFTFEKLLTNFIPFHFRLCRKSVFDEVGGFDHYPFVEDYDLTLKIAERSQVVFCPEATYFYRQHNESDSVNNQVEQIYFTKKAIEASLRRIGSQKKLAIEISRPRFSLR